MPNIIFVMGATATGKTHFIEAHFSNGGYEILDIFDYQNRLYDESGVTNHISFSMQRKLLARANQLILDDMLKLLSKGRNVVVEHTLFKTKRRIVYTDEIKKIHGVTIEIYVMQPSKEQWEANLSKRGMENRIERMMREADQIEFPNPAEGFDRIYEVVDDEIKLQMDSPTPEIIEPAREEIRRETEELFREEKEAEERRELLESMNHRSFWHYCEVCGKKELLTAEEAHNQGWDYPPRIGHFGMLSPRTCGDCPITDTLHWKVMSGIGLPIVIEKSLSPEELVTWRRIKSEPASLLEEE